MGFSFLLRVRLHFFTCPQVLYKKDDSFPLNDSYFPLICLPLDLIFFLFSKQSCVLCPLNYLIATLQIIYFWVSHSRHLKNLITNKGADWGKNKKLHNKEQRVSILRKFVVDHMRRLNKKQKLKIYK